jgi:arabinan endo-1,5-alpha-L-arabinosidase
VHDPSSIVRCGDEYWVFATGRGVPSRQSKDLVHWENGPPVFTAPLPWVAEFLPGHNGAYWAPDVIRVGDRYLLYYSVSVLGKRTSAIAVASNPTLDPGAPNYKWTDHGPVIRTSEADNYNAIDPSVMLDADGRLWMAFGSFWSGIKLLELDPATGKRKAPDAQLVSLAWHRQIEAATILREGEWYYLLVNWGQCCRGVNSTYEIRVGRSKSVTGPYLDKSGADLRRDGGTVLLSTDGLFIGPGHGAVLRDGADMWLSVHFYDGTNNGRPRLAIERLRFDANGWPVIEPADSKPEK